MLHENFVYLGALIGLIGGYSYLKDTLQGKVQPNRMTWGLWSIAVMIAFIAELSEGVGIQAMATFVTGFVPLLIFLASFLNRKAYWKLTRFDFLCGLFSVIGIILWQTTDNATFAIIFGILADFIAGVPTLIKSYLFPETENWKEYLAQSINVGITLLTIRTWTFAYWGFPLYILLFDFSAFLLIRFHLGKRIQAFIAR